MSTSSPPPSSHGAAGVPPASGNGKYIAVGVLLLVGMVGLVVWKFGGSHAEAPKPAPTVTLTVPAVPTDSKLDDVPPPPVIETAPDAGPAHVIVRQASDPCAVKTCNGSSTPELESALAVRAKQARRCYESELKSDPNLKGRLSIAVRVASNGAVCNATIASSEIPSIAPCVERVFRVTGGFPPPKGGCVEANVPMSFVPGR